MSRTPKQLMVGVLLVASAAAACAQANVHIKSEKKALKDGTFTVTIVLDNTGATAAEDYLVTTQPYNRLKEKGDPGFDATSKQTKFVTIGPGKEVTLTFKFSGAEAKDWSWKYTDVYASPKSKPVDASNGAWGAANLPAGNPGRVEEYVPLFYPDAVRQLRNGLPATFRFEIDDLSLPPGWSLAEFDPDPGALFELSPDTRLNLNVAFDTVPQLFAGDFASVDYTLIDVDDDIRYRGNYAVLVVPEPDSSRLVAVSLLILGALGSWRRARGAFRAAGLAAVLLGFSTVAQAIKLDCNDPTSPSYDAWACAQFRSALVRKISAIYNTSKVSIYEQYRDSYGPHPTVEQQMDINKFSHKILDDINAHDKDEEALISSYFNDALGKWNSFGGTNFYAPTCAGSAGLADVSLGQSCTLTFGYFDAGTGSAATGPAIAYVEYAVNNDPFSPDDFTLLGASHDPASSFAFPYEVQDVESAIQATPFDALGNPILLTSLDGHIQAANWVTLISSNLTDIQPLLGVDEPDAFVLCLLGLGASIGSTVRGRRLPTPTR